MHQYTEAFVDHKPLPCQLILQKLLQLALSYSGKNSFKKILDSDRDSHHHCITVQLVPVKHFTLPQKFFKICLQFFEREEMKT